MEAVWQSIVAGAPVLLLHVGIALAILIVGTVLYVWMTPWEDLKLVREGNTAAGVALGGIILGLGIPIAACIPGAINHWDILFWGIVTLILQMVTFKVLDFVLQGLPKRIEAGEVGAAVVLSAAKLAVAAIVAAAVSV
jgi:putative membrane protein